MQRSVLDVLQDVPSLSGMFSISTSFGGIKGRGVREALEAAHHAIEAGAKHYVRSDIQSFFTRIPKSTVHARIEEHIKDDEFLTLVRDATVVELSNLAALGANEALFPLHEIGVAQGCCLSPLMGNLLLADFDQQMNGRGVTCLRYIDDFILLGPTPAKVRRAFESAQSVLRGYGLTAYEPAGKSGKASQGAVSDGLEFLGCDIYPGSITANKGSRERLISSVREMLRHSAGLMLDPLALVAQHRTLVETLSEVDHVLRGWGNQYSYCNNDKVLQQLDGRIDSLIARYLADYRRKHRELRRDTRRQLDSRRLLGVHLLTDSKHDPIIS